MDGNNKFDRYIDIKITWNKWTNSNRDSKSYSSSSKSDSNRDNSSRGSTNNFDSVVTQFLLIVEPKKGTPVAFF